MRTAAFLVFGLVATFASYLHAADRPVAAVEHVLIVSIDGLRPDLALRADMPALRSLLNRGSFSFWARTTEVSVTLPSHASMLTGVTPNKHKISWNDDRATWEVLTYPTFLEKAKAAGYTTAMVGSKAKFKLFDKPGAVDHAFWPKTDSVRDDDTSATAAVAIIKQFKPGAMFIHFGAVDSAGHGIGWGTRQQMQVIADTDKLLGNVLAAYDEAGLTDKTMVILSADHGGSGRWHGANDVRARHIPWICAGPSVLAGQDLTYNRDLVINTEDTYVTACWLLGLDPGKDLDGKVVTDIFEKKELLQPVAPINGPVPTQAPEVMREN